MSIRSHIGLTLSAVLVAACTTKSPPPAIAYDSASFLPAVAETDPSPEPITETEMPPMPTLPPPAPAKPDRRPPTVRVEAANKAALQEPTSHGYINAVQVYPFVDGSLYRLYAAPEQVSDIALQPGETLSSVSAGDTVRWVIGDTTSGAGAEQRVHILVKPFAADLKTNLVITTNRRSYHLLLESTESTAMAVVSWTYPQDVMAAMRRNAAPDVKQAVSLNTSLEDIRFRYAITGDTPPWRPLRAFD
ncbi:MAG: P-type conjugative transfer protein TrbG, partial [Rhodospirillaceae bacterium]|nr:P-type conjugative transfer protein TrbG [Rhodospirillaceae bacterium]